MGWRGHQASAREDNTGHRRVTTRARSDGRHTRIGTKETRSTRGPSNTIRERSRERLDTKKEGTLTFSITSSVEFHLSPWSNHSCTDTTGGRRRVRQQSWSEAAKTAMTAKEATHAIEVQQCLTAGCAARVRLPSTCARSRGPSTTPVRCNATHNADTVSRYGSVCGNGARTKGRTNRRDNKPASPLARTQGTN